MGESLGESKEGEEENSSQFILDCCGAHMVDQIKDGILVSRKSLKIR